MKGMLHLTSAGVFLYAIDPPMSIPFIAGTLLGSVLPDSDIPSIGGLILPLWLVGARHRGRIHSWFAGILFALIGCLWCWEFGLGILLGFWIHLIGDGCTSQNNLKKICWPFK
jgi:membrane-bound metal-dependent hydrolase YbcI (DUF457 family)